MIKDRTYIVFEYVEMGDPANSYMRTHVCNSLEVFGWIQAAYDSAAYTGDNHQLAVHELGDCVFDTHGHVSDGWVNTTQGALNRQP